MFTIYAKIEGVARPVAIWAFRNTDANPIELLRPFTCEWEDWGTDLFATFPSIPALTDALAVYFGERGYAVKYVENALSRWHA